MTMKRPREIELMRLLHGELPPERARELRERLACEPDLARAYARLEAAWGGLELPPPAPVPRGFARAVAARGAEGGLWGVAPTWVRAGAAAALAAGLALGAGLGFAGRRWSESASPVSAPPASEVAQVAAPAAARAAPAPSPAPRPVAPVHAPGAVPVRPAAPLAPPGDLDFDTAADEGGLADGYWQALQGEAADSASAEGL